MATHAGMTTEEFEKIVRDWLATAQHPKIGPAVHRDDLPADAGTAALPARATASRPTSSRAAASSSCAPWAEQAYGIPPEQVIGSTIKTKFELRDGKPVIVRLPELDFIDDKAGKPVAINKFIGRRPILAFGNSDGDLEMLQWTAGRPRRALHGPGAPHRRRTGMGL